LQSPFHPSYYQYIFQLQPNPIASLLDERPLKNLKMPLFVKEEGKDNTNKTREKTIQTKQAKPSK